MTKIEQYRLAWQWVRIQANSHIIYEDTFGRYDWAVFPVIDLQAIDPTLLGIVIQQHDLRQRVKALEYWMQYLKAERQKTQMRHTLA